MDLKHLRYFKALAEELNFRKAADLLGITQPPLSQQIKELEDSLGTSLFLRLKNGNQLTEAGKVLYQYTLEIFEIIAQAEDHIKALKERDAGSFQLGIVSGLSGTRVGKLMQTFSSAKPKMNLLLTENCSSTLVQLVKEEKLDAALSYGPIIDDLLDWMPIAQTNYVLIHASDSKNVDELLLAPVILYKRQDQSFLFDQLMQVFQSRGIKPNIISELSSPRMRMLLVQQQLGISFVAKELATENKLVSFMRVPALAPVSIGIISRKKKKGMLNEEIKSIIFNIMQ